MNFWQKAIQKVKSWFSGGSSRKSTPQSSRGGSRRSPTYQSGRSVGGYRGSRSRSYNSIEEERRRRQREARAQAKASAPKPKYETKSIAKAISNSANTAGNTASKPASIIARKAEIDANREKAQKRLDELKKKRESKVQKEQTYVNARGDKVVVDESKSHRAQGKVGGTHASDMKYRMEIMPKSTSFARGAASGLSLGATELAAKNLAKKDKDRARAEKAYQENKSKGWEMAGEVAGSLVTFGGTAGATDKLGAKAVSKIAPRAAEKLAGKKFIQNSARRSINKALKKGAIEGAPEGINALSKATLKSQAYKEIPEELVKQVGKDRARKIVNAIGSDVAQNLTTGAIYDINKASAEHEVGSKDWWKTLGTSAALNFSVTGGIAGVSAFSGGKRLAKEGVKKLKAGANMDGLASAGRVWKGSRVAPRIGESIEDRIARIDAERLGKQTESKLSRNYLRGRLKNGNMTVSRGASDWKSALANANDFDEFVKSNAKNADVRKYVVDERNGVEGLEKLWRDSRIAKSRGSVRKLNLDNANEILGKSLPDSTRLEWFQNENSLAKPKLAHYIARDPEVLNAGMNIAYRNYADSVLGTPMSFEEWLVTPQKMYRGTTGKGLLKEDIFSAFTPDRRVAEKFAGKSADARIDEITVRPIDTLGSYAVSGEQEILVPKEVIEKATNAASLDVPENAMYNRIIKGGIGDETRIRNIGEAQASGDTVSAVNGEISARGGADNGLVERVADASSDAGRRSGDGVLRVSSKNRAKLTESGVADTHLSDVSDNYATFSNALDEAKAANGHGGWVDSQSVEDLADSKATALLSDDGYAGVAIKEDGDICGVFKNPASKHNGALYDLIYTARANGGTKMDCFGKSLANCYEGCGYKIVARIPFNPKYVDDPRLLKEKPDVYVLMKNTDDLDTVASKIRKSEANGGYHRSTQEELDQLPVFEGDDGYGNAMSYRDDLLAKQEAELAAKANAPKTVDDFAAVGEPLPSTNPKDTVKAETKADLKQRVEELEDIPFTDEHGNPVTGEEVKGVKVNNVAEDEAVSGSLPSGVKQVRRVYNYTNADEVVEGGVLTSWNDAWEASKAYSASHAKGEVSRQSKVAVSQLNAMDSNAERELRQKLVDSGELNYDAISSAEMYDKIAKQMRDDPNRWVKDMIEINEGGGVLDFRDTPEWQARVQYIMGTVDPSADEASEIAYTEAFKLAQSISSKGGQSLNLRRNFVHLTPMGKRDAILDDFINILDSSAGFRKNHPQLNSLGRFDQRNYIRKFLMEDDAIRDGVKKLVYADDPDDVSKAFAELMLNVNKRNPKSGFDVLQEIRYLNMLGNPKTHIRNIFGSAFFAPIRQTSNAIRSAIEKPIENYAKKVSGGAVEVTRHGGLSLTAAKESWVKNPTTEAGKAALEAFNRNKNEILGSAKYETMLYAGRGKTVVGKGIDKLSDFNSNLLAGEDDFFRSRAYRENYIKSYNRYLKDGKPITDKVKKRIEKEALEESRIATFNEYNEFASFLNNITRKANDPNASVGARWGGRVVNAVMPFTKVPANLMKQSMNYSPIGIAKGFANIKSAAKKGDAEALNVAIDQLASGLTGTGVFGLGMLLGKTTDMFTTNAGKNDPAAKFKKGQGVQNYSITFTDPITKEPHSYTLDWLVPTSATFFSGVELANQMKSGDFNLFDIGGDWSTVVTRLAEPVMETSMLSGLHGILETMRGGSNDDDTMSAIGIFLRETTQSYLSSLAPTFGGQAARTAYKTDMQITGEDDWEYFKNQMKSKTGLANTKILGDPLGADTDLYGNVKGEKNSAGDYAVSALKNFLSPSNIQKVDLSEVDKDKLAEYERRVKDGEDPEDLAYLFPKKQYKKQFKVAGDEVKMSNRDLSAYNQAKATGGEEGMRFALESVMFNRRTTDANGVNVPRDDAYTKEQKRKLMKQFEGKSIREVEKWVYEQPEFKNATPAERKKLIKGLWSYDSQFDSKANASRRVGEQAAIKAQGGDVDEYNFNNELSENKRKELQPAIDQGVLTYKQAVDFNRDAAKMGYYETEDGGYSKATFNRKDILAYLEKLDASEDTKEALYNAFYTGKTPYGAAVSRGRYGYGRRGYRRWGHGGGSSKVSIPKRTAAKVPKAKYKSMAATLPKVSSSSSAKFNTRSVKGAKVSLPKTKSSATAKIAPPKVKFKKYEV